MSDVRIQQQGQPLKSGFYDRNAFRQKSRSILVLKTAIAGIEYHIDDNTEDGRNLLNSLTPGTELNLFREPNNEHDKWAISVVTKDDRELGYITRFKNETIARLMDEGKVFHAFVDEPSDSPENDTETRRERTPTENFRLPFSVYMED
ncbi:MAG: HIRAN domain-containing protein [Parasporobacterium sp.]|nr:HIRAN domain-containing protein [Parasporobacterium sp.]